MLLSLPIVIAALIAGFLSFSSHPSYVSTASLWVDTPPGQNSSVGSAAQLAQSPAAEEQQLVTELLATRKIRLAIGKRIGVGPTEASYALATLTTSTPGPQVLQFSYAAGTPAAATKTLGAALTELQQASYVLIDQHVAGAVSLAKAQVQQANQALNAARNQLNTYVSEHPGSTNATPTFAALTQAEANANSELAQDNANLDSAELAQQSGGGFSVRTIDSPTPPYTTGGGKRKQAEGLLGGLIAGALISLLGTIALTKGKPDPWYDELVNGSTSARLKPSRTPDHASIATGPSDGVLADSAAGPVHVGAASGSAPEGAGSARNFFVANRRLILDRSHRGSNSGPS